MATWWNDLIKLWELSTGQPTPKPNAPGIYYAVKQALDRTRLIEDIGCVLERGLLENRAPAGYIVGALRPGSVGLNFSRDERETLHDHGINPIIVKNGIPFVWGQYFHNAVGDIHSISNNCGRFPGLTPEFRAWIGERNDGTGQIGKRHVGDHPMRERFKVRRYVEMMEDETLIGECTGTKDCLPKVDPWHGRPGTLIARPVAQKMAVEPPTVTGERVHALHRAIGARPQQIGLVTLDDR